jgi:hypothetical protein
MADGCGQLFPGHFANIIFVSIGLDAYFFLRSITQISASCLPTVT